MVTNAKCRHLLLPPLAGVLWGCLALPAPADEIEYLPDGTHVVMSANFQDALKSKAFDEMNKKLKELGRGDVVADMTSGLDIPAANIARITTSQVIRIVTTNKPITAAAIIAAKKDVTIKEIKVGSFTIHEASYNADDQQRSESFCVIEGKTILFSRTEMLRQVLERNKKPELPANLQTGLKHAGFNNTLS